MIKRLGMCFVALFAAAYGFFSFSGNPWKEPRSSGPFPATPLAGNEDEASVTDTSQGMGTGDRNLELRDLDVDELCEIIRANARLGGEAKAELVVRGPRVVRPLLEKLCRRPSAAAGDIESIMDHIHFTTQIEEVIFANGRAAIPIVQRYGMELVEKAESSLNGDDDPLQGADSIYGISTLEGLLDSLVEETKGS